jgi:hypothetical protein
VKKVLTKNEYWKSNVTTHEDAVNFFERFYGYLPKPVQLAYVDFIERGLRGEIELPEDFIRKNDSHEEEPDDAPWDYVRELKEEHTKGLINKAISRIEKVDLEKE